MQSLRRPELYAAIFRMWLTAAVLCCCVGARGQTAPVAGQTSTQPTSQPPSAGIAAQTAPAGADAALPGDPLFWLRVASPDENADGLVSAQGLPTTLNVTALDGVETTQRFGAVPAGAAQERASDPEADSDAAEITTGPAFGLGRGRFAGAPLGFAHEAVVEARVTPAPNAFSQLAQMGFAGGAEYAERTRSGGAVLHGSLGFQLRSQLLAAAEPFAIATSYTNGVVSTEPVKPHDLRENFTAILGGPVPRAPRFRFFYAFAAQRRGFPAIASPANPGFYDLTATQRALLANRGVTAADVNAGLDYLSSLTGLVDRRADASTNFGRIDWAVRPRLQLGLEYAGERWTSPAGLLDAPVVARGRGSLGDSIGSLDQLVLRVTMQLSRSLRNEATVAIARDLQFEQPQPNLAQEPGVGPGGRAPEVNIGPNGLLFGTPATLSQQAYPDERRLAATELLSGVRGRQSFAAGGSFALVRDAESTLPNAAGTFLYDSGTTGGHAGGLVDFLTDQALNVNVIPNGGCPSVFAAAHFFCFRSFTQSFGEQTTAFTTAEFAGFADDTWRVSARLSLHLGLRYEYVLLPLPQQPNVALDVLFGSRGATSVFPEDRNNLQPRLGVAWQPLGDGKGMVRAGIGLYGSRVPGATIGDALSRTALPGSTMRIRIRPTTITSCPQVPAQGFGYPCAFSTAPPGAVEETTSALVFDRGFRLPVVAQGSLEVERSLARTNVSVGYAFHVARQLPSSTDLNIAPSAALATFQLQGGTAAPGVRDGETFRLPLYTSRLSPQFGPVTDLVSHVNGSYHALVLRAASRVARGVELDGGYTWSKAIDYAPDLSANPRTDGQLDPYRNGYDKGLSSLNYPWSLHVSAVLALRVESSGRALRRLLDGWTVTPLVVARAGRPYSLNLSGGTYLPGGHESLNGSGGALYLPTVGRDTLRLPATVQADLALRREFAAGSRARLFCSVEAFNVANHQNVSSVTTRAFLVGAPVNGVTPLVFQSATAIAAEGLNAQAFGVPTGASTSTARERQVEFAVRLAF